MRVTLFGMALTMTLSPFGLAQQWEAGAAVGYGWLYDSSISNSNIGQSASAGLHPGLAVGGLLGDNMYKYIGGEARYLFQWGSPQLQYQGTRADMSGYSNLLVYDLLVHMTSRDSRVRPYVAGGAGIKIYTGTSQQYLTQPLERFAVLVPNTQVEPAISVGAGLKYRIKRHTLLRADFRAYMTPLPDELFRTTGASAIRGWIFDFVPQVGISYLF
jgi:Outer membrane protein beta-barrel domain